MHPTVIKAASGCLFFHLATPTKKNVSPYKPRKYTSFQVKAKPPLELRHGSEYASERVSEWMTLANSTAPEATALVSPPTPAPLWSPPSGSTAYPAPSEACWPTTPAAPPGSRAGTAWARAAPITKMYQPRRSRSRSPSRSRSLSRSRRWTRRWTRRWSCGAVGLARSGETRHPRDTTGVTPCPRCSPPPSPPSSQGTVRSHAHARTFTRLHSSVSEPFTTAVKKTTTCITASVTRTRMKRCRERMKTNENE